MIGSFTQLLPLMDGPCAGPGLWPDSLTRTPDRSTRWHYSIRNFPFVSLSLSLCLSSFILFTHIYLHYALTSRSTRTDQAFLRWKDLCFTLIQQTDFSSSYKSYRVTQTRYRPSPKSSSHAASTSHHPGKKSFSNLLFNRFLFLVTSRQNLFRLPQEKRPDGILLGKSSY